MKFWTKWLRKIHRWLSVPMFILITASVVLKVSGNGAIMANIPAWEMIQSILMLFLAISGIYLCFLPYITKRIRNKKRTQRSAMARVTSNQ